MLSVLQYNANLHKLCFDSVKVAFFRFFNKQSNLPKAETLGKLLFKDSRRLSYFQKAFLSALLFIFCQSFIQKTRKFFGTCITNGLGQ